ncbi:hypothetical protein AX774_g4953 [Zancudomyces culisetae]|uniref:Uncharacterized protein n=1 Tax=Zancudomyces culisetae TaxID=1213189 RepID=A0A1R1PL10_ZANCU|nr:hypothetical protein AX774_g4953 [Zancudomyces culisetae]|eukprot:OMH81562.1 hypothetical protein AX774_g4953 [Zancudomyces culisetae]
MGLYNEKVQPSSIGAFLISRAARLNMLTVTIHVDGLVQTLYSTKRSASPIAYGAEFGSMLKYGYSQFSSFERDFAVISEVDHAMFLTETTHASVVQICLKK